MNIEITNIEKSDIPNIFEINKTSNLTFWSENQFLSELVQESEFNLKLQIDDRKIIGFIFSSFIVDNLNINNICILPEHQHKGFGSLILNHSLLKARKKNGKKAFLEVRSINFKALKLYQKFGFIIDTTRRNYYANGDDAVLMSLDLSLLNL